MTDGRPYGVFPARGTANQGLPPLAINDSPSGAKQHSATYTLDTGRKLMTRINTRALGAVGLVFLGMALIVDCTAEEKEAEDKAKLESALTKGWEQYQAALKAGLELDMPGAGKGPISHVSLFSEYAKVFYLPLNGLSQFSTPSRFSFLSLVAN